MSKYAHAHTHLREAPTAGSVHMLARYESRDTREREEIVATTHSTHSFLTHDTTTHDLDLRSRTLVISLLPSHVMPCQEQRTRQLIHTHRELASPAAANALERASQPIQGDMCMCVLLSRSLTTTTCLCVRLLVRSSASASASESMNDLWSAHHAQTHIGASRHSQAQAH